MPSLKVRMKVTPQGVWKQEVGSEVPEVPDRPNESHATRRMETLVFRRSVRREMRRPN